MKSKLFELFVQAETDHQLLHIQNTIHQEGYSGFRLLVDGLMQRIKSSLDNEMKELEALLHKGKQLFPTPVEFSPAWERIWYELEQMIAHKSKILQTIAPVDRDGEWQIIIDNPYAVQEVVCYPALSFLDAVYLFAYFRPDLEKNEYLRLQKIQTLVMDFGS